ncbi:MAG: hypothetical protein Q9199_001481 [Rusavskia elegans]
MVGRSDQRCKDEAKLEGTRCLKAWRQLNGYLGGIFTSTGDPVFKKRLEAAGIDPDKQPQEAGVMWIDNVWHGRAHSWEKMAWLIKTWKETSGGKPFCLKGIQSVDDAKRAVEAGCDGIVVSNHAGRQVDGAIASLDLSVGQSNTGEKAVKDTRIFRLQGESAHLGFPQGRRGRLPGGVIEDGWKLWDIDFEYCKTNDIAATDAHGSTALHYRSSHRDINEEPLDLLWEEDYAEEVWRATANRYGFTAAELFRSRYNIIKEQNGFWKVVDEWKGPYSKRKKIWEENYRAASDAVVQRALLVQLQRNNQTYPSHAQPFRSVTNVIASNAKLFMAEPEKLGHVNANDKTAGVVAVFWYVTDLLIYRPEGALGLVNVSTAWPRIAAENTHWEDVLAASTL